MTLLSLKDIPLKGKRVLVREDFNVPMQNGVVTNDVRIRAALPTLEYLIAEGAQIILMSHLGRPTEGSFDKDYSLAPITDCLCALLNKPVRFINDPFQAFPMQNGDVVLLENTRFWQGEESNDSELSQKLAGLCDVFVMDAFATAHRKHASTYGVASYAKQAIAGPLLQQEVHAIEKILENPTRPLVAIVGGAKISSKLALLENLLSKVDTLIVGGGIANTFLAANGVAVGASLVEKELIDKAKTILAKAKPNAIPLPIDVVTAEEFNASAKGTVKALAELEANDRILDIGPQTAAQYAEIIGQAGTILWNGPVGVFEFPEFQSGTKTLAMAIKNSAAFSVAGGGDTIAAIDQFGMHNDISYISTGGGAFLTYLEQGQLPCIEVLACK